MTPAIALLLSVATAPPPAAKTEIMIVGVAHLVARRDVHNSTFTDSPLSPARQSQVADVVSRLARFQPTKVLLEATMADPKYAQRYAGYLRGSYTLPADEVYQFGFRLAKAAGNSTIYPIDTWGPQLYDDKSATGKRIDAYLEANLPNVPDSAAEPFLKNMDALERNGTYLDLMRFLNTDAAIRANASYYSIIDGVGRANDQAGAAFVSQWYVRNNYIFANILDAIAPGDRVVVLIGQGHEYLLRDLVRLNPNLIDVDPLEYLN